MKTAYYKDEGAEAVVEVLQDTAPARHRVVKLRVIKEVCPSPIHGPLPTKEFTVTAIPGTEHIVGWSLDYVECTSYEDEPVCPWCGTKDEDWAEYEGLHSDGDRIVADCPNCELKYDITLCVSYNFSTDAVTQEELNLRHAKRVYQDARSRERWVRVMYWRDIHEMSEHRKLKEDRLLVVCNKLTMEAEELLQQALTALAS